MPFFISAHHVKKMNRIMVGKYFNTKTYMNVPIIFIITKISRTIFHRKIIIEYTFTEDMSHLSNEEQLNYMMFIIFSSIDIPRKAIHRMVAGKMKSYFNLHYKKIYYKDVTSKTK